MCAHVSSCLLSPSEHEIADSDCISKKGLAALHQDLDQARTPCGHSLVKGFAASPTCSTHLLRPTTPGYQNRGAPPPQQNNSSQNSNTSHRPTPAARQSPTTPQNLPYPPSYPPHMPPPQRPSVGSGSSPQPHGSAPRGMPGAMMSPMGRGPMPQMPQYLGFFPPPPQFFPSTGESHTAWKL